MSNPLPLRRLRLSRRWAMDKTGCCIAICREANVSIREQENWLDVHDEMGEGKLTSFCRFVFNFFGGFPSSVVLLNSCPLPLDRGIDNSGCHESTDSCPWARLG
jgi:hypothetical protein